MAKELTLTSAATTLIGVGVYSDSNSSNNDNDNNSDNNDDHNSDNNDDNDGDDSNTSPEMSTYIGIGVVPIVLLSAFIPLLIICLF